MKLNGFFVLSCLAVLGAGSLAARAESPSETLGISTKFPGLYQLQSTTGSGDKHCPKQVRVDVTVDEVTVSAIDQSTGFMTRQYLAKDAGCKQSDGDLGPTRSSCTTFSDEEVKYTETEPVTVMGFIRTYDGIRLGVLSFDTLIYEKDQTLVPFGFMHLWDDNIYSCAFKRIEE